MIFCNVLVRIKNGGYITLAHNFTNIAENVCDCPNEIFSCLDNFEWLKLIGIPRIYKKDKIGEGNKRKVPISNFEIVTLYA